MKKILEKKYFAENEKFSTENFPVNNFIAEIRIR